MYTDKGNRKHKYERVVVVDVVVGEGAVVDANVDLGLRLGLKEDEDEDEDGHEVEVEVEMGAKIGTVVRVGYEEDVCMDVTRTHFTVTAIDTTLMIHTHTYTHSHSHHHTQCTHARCIGTKQ